MNRLLNRLADLFPLWVRSMSGLALFFPQWISWFGGPMIVWSLAIIMIGMGITLSDPLVSEAIADSADFLWIGLRLYLQQ